MLFKAEDFRRILSQNGFSTYDVKEEIREARYKEYSAPRYDGSACGIHPSGISMCISQWDQLTGDGKCGLRNFLRISVGYSEEHRTTTESGPTENDLNMLVSKIAKALQD
jgi:hypothetical protein